MNSKPCKKVLVRNCEQNINKAEKSKIKAISSQKPDNQIDKLINAYQVKSDKNSKCKTRQVDLDKPVLNSALAIGKQIQEVKAAKSIPEPCSSKNIKSESHLECNAKKALNFPPEQHLYKDLVELNIGGSSNEYSIPVSKSRPYPMRKKDPVLNIEDFYGPEEPNFIYPEIETVKLPPRKPYKIFDMHYIQNNLGENHHFY